MARPERRSAPCRRLFLSPSELEGASTMRKLCVLALAGLCGLFVTASAHAQWGTLKGQIVLDGEVPEVKLLVKKGDAAAKDAAVCAAQDVPDESLAVDKDSKGIANVAVWLVAKKGLKVHPNLEVPANANVTFDQVGCRFIPHVMVVHTSQTVQVVSGDAIAHNTRGTPLKNQGFNFIVAPNARKGTPQTMKLAERLPVQIGCDIHTWMRAYWVVLDHPYAAVTDKDGKFEIKDLPAGDHEFKVWHERPGYVYKDKKDPKKGLIVTIKDGETTEVPVIKVPLATLEGKK
jgi:hypothetical protein